MDEFALIQALFGAPAGDPDVLLGVGDDAAVCRWPGASTALVSCVDTMVEGIHYFASTEPAMLGQRLAAVNVSDLAAMGARPRWALLAMTVSGRHDLAWWRAFRDGLCRRLQAAGAVLIGGDTTSTPGPEVLSLTLLGECPAGGQIRRSGGRPGDRLMVTGTLGDAACAVQRTYAGERVCAVLQSALDAPPDYSAFGVRMRPFVTAAIDLSDGLASDLQHVLVQSGCGARVELSALPTSDAVRRAVADRDQRLTLQVAGGDDYQLCLCVPEVHLSALSAVAAAEGVMLTDIGALVQGSAIDWRWCGDAYEAHWKGYSHDVASL